MRRLPFLLSAIFLSLLGACADDYVCVDTVSTCEAWETADNLVMSGYWSGRYDVGWHHMMGRNELVMSWGNGGYEVRVEREGVFREAFYRTSSFYGYGELEPMQNEFWANYSTNEDWMFHGSYHKAGNRMVFEGRVFANGADVGSFRLSRPRECVEFRQTELNRCVGTWTPEPDDQEPYDPGEGFELAVTMATVSPNPVEPMADLTLHAEASREGDGLLWTVMMAPLTDTTKIVGAWQAEGKVFHVQTAAPPAAGDYRVRFEVADGDESNTLYRLLTVH